jgi:hypothetical protein
MSGVPPSQLPLGPPRQLPQKPVAFPGKLGRIVVWFQTVFRSDDKKIDTILNRLDQFQSEREWALQQLFGVEKTLQKRIQKTGNESDTKTLIKTQNAVYTLLHKTERSVLPAAGKQTTALSPIQKAFLETVANRILSALNNPAVTEGDVRDLLLLEIEAIRTASIGTPQILLNDLANRVLPHIPVTFSEVKIDLLNLKTPSIDTALEKIISVFKNESLDESTLILKLMQLLVKEHSRLGILSSPKFRKTISDLAPKNRLILRRLLSSLENMDQAAFPRACQRCGELIGRQTFSKLEEAQQKPETIHSLIDRTSKETLYIPSLGITLFRDPRLDVEISDALTSGITKGLVEEISGMSLPPLSVGENFTQALNNALSGFSSLESLAKEFGIEKDVNEAIEKVVARDCAETKDAIIEYCHHRGEFDFERWRECCEALSKCPVAVQIPILVSVRNQLKTSRKLPKELTPPFEKNSPIDRLPPLAQDVFTYTSMQTLADWEKTQPKT